MLDDLRRGIRQFAKRQRTWFRGLPARGIDVTWVGPDDHDVLLKHEFSAPRVAARLFARYARSQ